MAHWKEIGKKYNKLVKLLREKGIIDEFEALNLFTEDYNLKKLLNKRSEVIERKLATRKSRKD